MSAPPSCQLTVLLDGPGGGRPLGQTAGHQLVRGPLAGRGQGHLHRGDTALRAQTGHLPTIIIIIIIIITMFISLNQTSDLTRGQGQTE